MSRACLNPALPIAAHLPGLTRFRRPRLAVRRGRGFLFFLMGRALPSEFESLAQPDDLRCEPLAARRRRDLAPIELGGGSICRQVASSVRIGRRRSARSVASAAVL